jgi:hypothetical protein
LGILFLVSCEKTIEKTTEITPSASVRLKLTTDDNEVATLVSDVVQDYEKTGLGHHTLAGNYPVLPYEYSYAIVWFKWPTGGNWFQYRAVTAGTKAGDSTREQNIRGSAEFYEIKDDRLNKSPYTNVYVLKSLAFSKKSWRYRMYLNQDAIKQEDHIINLDGGYNSFVDSVENLAAEPLTDSVAITMMLKLTDSTSN